jgi:hypothetical protein
MSRKVSIATILVLILCTAGAASALPLDADVAEPVGEAGFLGGLWERLLDWIDRMAGDGGDGPTLYQTDGCHIDPNGACLGGS